MTSARRLSPTLQCSRRGGAAAWPSQVQVLPAAMARTTVSTSTYRRVAHIGLWAAWAMVSVLRGDRQTVVRAATWAVIDAPHFAPDTKPCKLSLHPGLNGFPHSCGPPSGATAWLTPLLIMLFRRSPQGRLRELMAILTLRGCDAHAHGVPPAGCDCVAAYKEPSPAAIRGVSYWRGSSVPA